MEITKNLVEEHFEYRDGFLYWKSNRLKSKRADKRAGYLQKKKRESRYIIFFYNKGYPAAKLIFLLHHGYMPKIVDHIDRDCTNDRIENLREATPSQNGGNRKSAQNSSSQYLGVCLRKGKYWHAHIRINGNQLYLGSFKTEIESALCYNRAAVKYHKEFANLNIIKLKTEK